MARQSAPERHADDFPSMRDRLKRILRLMVTEWLLVFLYFIVLLSVIAIIGFALSKGDCIYIDQLIFHLILGRIPCIVCATRAFRHKTEWTVLLVTAVYMVAVEKHHTWDSRYLYCRMIFPFPALPRHWTC